MMVSGLGSEWRRMTFTEIETQIGEQVWVRNSESHFGHVELDWAWEMAKWRGWKRKSLGES